ncbi:maleylpyruvate isomerase family mycothiol-dependent enzyme [Allostreptomyces psammosilenae]|uniref:Uncharacterized protein (TIGR03083 family) n=1 Tax=Allostreptomyces psammosilenae TaxID=1892865 RepID=A0A852ZVP6_9ACTN|nr:maleylpyruvate isomerase family mycothiol-dependent enzyme [Allostreptomyces psammosilenae]NYI05320.1 uncharacterized protein (TIGR03083 family) [Allostreptomyces psammosilenae]
MEDQIFRRSAGAWQQSLTSLLDLARLLTNRGWNVATECPGWSVRDVISHVIGMERELLGDPRPIHALPTDLAHVRDEHGRRNEVQVDVRRCHTGPEMLAELEETLRRRQRAIEAERRGDDDVVATPWGARPLGELLRMRAFDVWVHEQDVRRAVRVPANLDSPAALIARDVLLAGLAGAIAGRVADGATVVLDVQGPVEFLRTVRVEDGVGRLQEQVPLAPDAQLTFDWELFARLACGRIRPAAADVKVEGDEALARQVLGGFAVTR